MAAEFLPGREKTDEVLVNVWGYGPGWTVEILEGDKPLAVERVRTKDPLYLLSCPIPYLAQGRELIGTVRPVTTMHAFKAKASAPDTDVTVRVTDREGRVYSKVMHRPEAFGLELY